MSHGEGAGERAKRAQVPAIAFLLAGVAFVTGSSSMIVAGLLVEIADSLGISVGQAGLIITVFAVGVLIGAPLVSVATLRMSYRVTLICALVVFAGGHVGVALASDLTTVLIARVISAVATGAFWAIGMTVAAEAAGPQSSARTVGVVIGGVTLASILGVPLGAAIGQIFGWRAPFWALAVCALAATGVLALRLPRSTPRARPTLASELGSLASPRLILVYVAHVLAAGAVIASYAYIAPLLSDRAHVPTEWIPFAMLAYGVCGCVGTFAGAHLGDRWPHHILISAGVLIVLTSAALAVVPDGPAVVPLILLLGLASLVSNPVLVSEVRASLRAASALGMALSTSSFNIGIALGSSAAGMALLAAADLRAAPTVGAVLAILYVLVGLGLARSGAAAIRT